MAPWVALAYDGHPAAAAEAHRVLDDVQLATCPRRAPRPAPDYQHYWIDRVRPGLARLWPLPWPGRFDRAGWRTILVSWLLMLLLAALAVLIAILIFRNQPPQSPPPPTGSSGSPPPQSSSPSPAVGIARRPVRIALAAVGIAVAVGRVAVARRVRLAVRVRIRRPLGQPSPGRVEPTESGASPGSRRPHPVRL